MTVSPFSRASCWCRVITILSITGRAYTLMSCTPPRFDIFSQKIVGSWYTDAPPAQGNKQVADEVMRSCGGAVQGVRDIPLISSLYLNRADDGFDFFDCGSYTHGPVQLSTTDENGMTTSLTLSTMSRVMLSCTLDTEKQSSKLKIASALHRVKFGDDGSALTPENFHCRIIEESQGGMSWYEQQQCRMSSPGQPWMLQRAQWETKRDGDPLPEFQSSDSLQAWAVVQSGVDGEISYSVDNTASGLLFTMGVVCTETGCIKAVTRTYNENGMLVTVALKSGRIQGRPDTNESS